MSVWHFKQKAIPGKYGTNGVRRTDVTKKGNASVSGAPSKAQELQSREQLSCRWQRSAVGLPLMGTG